jgi:hypothetical protein
LGDPVDDYDVYAESCVLTVFVVVVVRTLETGHGVMRRSDCLDPELGGRR